MHITHIERASGPGSGRYREIARFNAEIDENMRLFHVRLLQDDAGQRIVIAPPTGGGRCATFSLPLAKALTAAASDALTRIEGNTPHDQHRN